MQEGIGLAAMTETPVVIVNSMRAGPSTGMPTLAAQGDFLQTQFGSHGDYGIVALAPNSAQETFDLTIESFNLAELLRTPVVLLLDQLISSTHERVEIPPEEDVRAYSRPKHGEKSDDTPSWLDMSYVSPMKCFGEGHRSFGTGLTHDEDGRPSLLPDVHEKLVRRLTEKLRVHLPYMPEPERYYMDDAKIAVVAYGSSARAAEAAVVHGRAEGLRIGLLRFRTLWPFPKDVILDLATEVDRILVVEMSLGQLLWPVERFAGRSMCSHLGSVRGRPSMPTEILTILRRLNN
jgi:2-oxoglutarate ferredoxin oxidoreductase subunit alpha